MQQLLSLSLSGLEAQPGPNEAYCLRRERLPVEGMPVTEMCRKVPRHRCLPLNVDVTVWHPRSSRRGALHDGDSEFVADVWLEPQLCATASDVGGKPDVARDEANHDFAELSLSQRQATTHSSPSRRFARSYIDKTSSWVMGYFGCGSERFLETHRSTGISLCPYISKGA